MLKKTITYLDLDDNEIIEDFYFNLSKAEITEAELSMNGGLSEHLKRILASQNRAEIVATFKKIVAMTIGQRSEDNKSFMKSPEITAAFMNSNAYSVLFLELLTDENKAAEFIRGAVPSDIAAQISVEDMVKTVELPNVEKALPEKKIEDYTEHELINVLTDEEFNELVGTDPQKMSKDLLVIAMRRKTVSK